MNRKVGCVNELQVIYRYSRRRFQSPAPFTLFFFRIDSIKPVEFNRIELN